MRRIVFWLLWAGLAVAAPPWKPFRSFEGGFSIVFPGNPKASQSQTNTPLGAVTTKVFSASSGPAAYAVAFTELPGAAVKFAAAQVVSDAREGVLKDAGAEQTAWTELPKGGHELAYQSARYQGWCQFFLIGNRLYVVDARLKKGASRIQYADPFLCKFSVL